VRTFFDPSRPSGVANTTLGITVQHKCGRRNTARSSRDQGPREEALVESMSDLCRQRIVHIPRVPTMHSGRRRGGSKENPITANKVFLAVKTGKAAGCDKIRPGTLKALNRERDHWLPPVPSGMTFWKGTERLVGKLGWSSPHKQGDRKQYNNYRGFSLLSLPRKVHDKCLEKRCHEIIEPKLDDAQCGFRPGVKQNY